MCRDAGTSANGFITIIGTECEAGPCRLLNTGINFQRGQLGVFTLDALPDVGSIEQVMHVQ